jgi:Rhodopirellula transposase DDE domain
LKAAFVEVVEQRAAGSPVKAQTWTDLTVGQIQERLMEKDLYVCLDVVRDLLEEEGYGLREMQKYLDMGQHKDRDAQFNNIARIKAEYLASGDPILSIDTKKKEWLGTFYRAGKLYTRYGPVLAYDHDYQRFATGVVVPYGLYDLKRNQGYVNVGTSKDTSEFACDSVEWWWRGWGHRLYPGAKRLCLLADGGGSNHVDKYLFKEDLQKLADRLGLEVRLAHYPPYCSKYNPIERKLFCHLTRAAQGVIFDTVETVKGLFEKARTAAGLGVVVTVSHKVYQLGRKYAEGFKQNMKILFDDFLPRWNYRAVPQSP